LGTIPVERRSRILNPHPGFVFGLFADRIILDKIPSEQGS